MRAMDTPMGWRKRYRRSATEATGDVDLFLQYAIEMAETSREENGCSHLTSSRV